MVSVENEIKIKKKIKKIHSTLLCKDEKNNNKTEIVQMLRAEQFDLFLG